MPYTIRIRRDNYTNLSTVTLGVGEIAYDTTNKQLRIGDGTTVFSSLTAIGGGAGGDIATDQIWSAKGELAVSTGNNAASVLSLGTTKQVLVVDTAQTLGMKWDGILNTFNTQTANTVLAGPTTGTAAAPTFRGLVAGDIPDISATYQAADATLASLAGLTIAADSLPYGTGSDTFGTTTLTAFGRSLIDDADAETARTTLGFKTVLGVATSPQAETTIKYVRAAQASLTKGMVVYVSGSNGNNLNVSKAQANAESTSSKTIGLLLQNLSAVGDLGYVITEGLIEGLDTNGLTPGTAVWLSPTTAGGWTTTKPSSPNHLVFLGWVVKDNASTGSIYIKVNNGQELDELHDVAITSATNNDVLQWDTSTTPPTWKNKTLANAGIAASSHTHGGISNAGAIGTTSGLPIKTGTSGVLEVGAFGTSAGQFAEGNHLHGNISNDGKIGTTAGRVIVTTSGGTLDALADGSPNYVLSTNGSGTLSWVAQSGGGGTPGGTDTQVQFNDGGSTFGGDSGLTYNKTTDMLTVVGGITINATNELRLADTDSSHYVGFKSPGTVSANKVWTLPSTDGTDGQVLKTNGSATLSWGAGGTKTIAVFTPLDNQAPSTAFATLDTQNNISVLDFSDTVNESAVFVGIIPEGVTTANGLTAWIYWTSTSTSTTDIVEWRIEFANLKAGNLLSRSYDTDTSSNSKANSGNLTITSTDIGIGTSPNALDSLVAGDPFAMRITRLATGTTDNLTTDAMLIAVELRVT